MSLPWTRFVSSFALLPIVVGCTALIEGEGDGGGEDNPHLATGGSTSHSSGGGSSTGTGGSVNTGSGGGGSDPVCTSTCTDEPPPDQDPTCAQWKEWGTCGEEWFQGYCQESCGTCDNDDQICVEPTTGGSSSGSGGGPVVPDPSIDPLPPGAASGWASRYWDCCKPHCAWSANSPGGAMHMCDINDNPISDPDAGSGCSGGPAYTCWSMAPWAKSASLAYGFAATPAGGNDCGKCYQIEFTGEGQHNPGDPGSGSLKGKTMIVQSTNVGGDVGSGQFDLLIPGGGVGAFNGCSTQWGTSDLGAQYGGFLTECNGSVSCLKSKCQEVFGDKPELLAGCLFHAEWMQGADNPKLRYAEVECPAELEAVSGMAL